MMREPNWDVMEAELLALKSKELKAVARREGITSAGSRSSIVSYIIKARKARYLRSRR